VSNNKNAEEVDVGSRELRLAFILLYIGMFIGCLLDILIGIVIGLYTHGHTIFHQFLPVNVSRSVHNHVLVRNCTVLNYSCKDYNNHYICSM